MTVQEITIIVVVGLITSFIGALIQIVLSKEAMPDGLQRRERDGEQSLLGRGIINFVYFFLGVVASLYAPEVRGAIDWMLGQL